jgi:hypothetical protein
MQQESPKQPAYRGVPRGGHTFDAAGFDRHGAGGGVQPIRPGQEVNNLGAKTLRRLNSSAPSSGW